MIGLALVLFSVTKMVSAATDEPLVYRYANVRIGGGGFVSGLTFHPGEHGLYYARTDVGGAYRWDPSSRKWIPLTDWLDASEQNLYGIDSIALDPSDPERVYLAAGTYTTDHAGNGAILRSRDRGRSFERSDLPFKLGGNELGRGNGERLAVDPHDGRVLFFGSRGAGLWRSDDHGAHWARARSFPAVATAPSASSTNSWRSQAIGIVFVVFDPTSGRAGQATPILYAGVSTQETSLFRSTDGGDHWSAVPGQPQGLRPNHMVRAADGAYYLSYGDEPGPDVMHNGAVWKYTPADGRWIDVTPLPQPATGPGFGWGAVTVDPHDPNVVMTATFARYTPRDELFRSVDGGRHWQAVFPRSTFDYSDAVWTREHTPHWLASIEIDPFDPEHVLFVTGYGIWASRDMLGFDHGKTVHWQFQDRGLEETVPLDLISPPQGAHLLSAVGDLDGYRHDDLDKAPLQFDAPPRYANSESIDYAGQRPARIVRSGYLRKPFAAAIRVAYSNDGGVHWQAFGSEPPEGDGAGSIAIAADGDTVLWFPNHAKQAYVTEDLGQHWRTVTGLTAHARVLSDRIDAKRFYAYDDVVGKIFVSSDAGEHFTPIDGELGAAAQGHDNLRLYAAPDAAGVLYLANRDRGMLRGRDDGKVLHVFEGWSGVDALGFGRAAPGQVALTLFAAGRRQGVQGIYRSIDAGAHWQRVDDADHRYGLISHLIGDPRIYGRVYFATGGRGIVYGEPADKVKP